MFVLAVLVPALLVVVLGYAAGYAAWAAIGAPLVQPEAVGWTAGVLLLVVVVRVLLSRWRRRGRRPGE